VLSELRYSLTLHSLFIPVRHPSTWVILNILIQALKQAGKLYNAEAAAKKDLKSAQAELDIATLEKYGDLTEEDVKALVLDDKWEATVLHRIAGEAEALTLNLVARIQQLGERYAATVGSLDAELQSLEAQVSRHLAAMGVE